MATKVIRDYTCKFCGRKGQVKAHIEPGIRVKVELWVKMLACNRCADYYQAAYRCKDAIASWCNEWQVWWKGPFAKENEKKIRERLVMLTKKYATLTCRFFRLPPSWEPTMVDNMMSNPKEVYIQLGDYYRKVKSEHDNRNNTDPF